jgi:hypothetical protein
MKSQVVYYAGLLDQDDDISPCPHLYGRPSDQPNGSLEGHVRVQRRISRRVRMASVARNVAIASCILSLALSVMTVWWLGTEALLERMVIAFLSARTALTKFGSIRTEDLRALF